MKRQSILRILNPILAVLVVNQVLTGIFHEALPHETFEVMHENGGLVVAAAAILHVSLNWNWVKANFFRSTTARRS